MGALGGSAKGLEVGKHCQYSGNLLAAATLSTVVWLPRFMTSLF